MFTVKKRFFRFQENEGVQKSIQNAIRYHADKDFKSQYHSDLEQQILARDNKAQAVREQDVNISRQLEVKSDFFQSLDLTMTTSLGG